jgi:hypothetical protein
VKLPKSPRSDKRADRRVAWWSALLLVALGIVLTALFYSGRYVLSLDHEGDPQERHRLECRLGVAPLASHLLPFHAKPNRAEPDGLGT